MRDTPFRLGSTSYVYPGDLATNAERLAGQVRDIELIVFETDDGESNVPDAAMIARLNAVRAAHDLTYTVHLPLDLEYDSAHDHRSITLAKRVIDLTAALDPAAVIFHLEGTHAGSAAWRDNRIRAVESLLPSVDDPRLLALENLENYLPAHLEPVFDALPVARTLDIGHLLKAGAAPLPVMDVWLPEARVVHLHGVRDESEGRVDHLSLDVLPAATLDALVARLQAWTGVLTLEVFEDDFFTSRAAFLAAVGRLPR
jgi:sugar phosphate isomerase/epimerase